MNAARVYSLLKRKNTVFLSVPCSRFKELLAILEKKREVIYCSNEEEVLGMGAGLALCSKTPIALIQNSGLGKMLNVYFSLNKLYGLPLLFIISWRGKGKDAPEHFYIGKKTPMLLRAAGIEFRELGYDEQKVMKNVNYAFSKLKRGESFALLLDKGMIS